MNPSSPFTHSSRVRRLIVTLVVGTAAAGTAGVVLNEPPAGEAAAGRAAVGTALADPWQRPASDPSLPDAAKALERASDLSSSERAPTF